MGDEGGSDLVEFGTDLCDDALFCVSIGSGGDIWTSTDQKDDGVFANLIRRYWFESPREAKRWSRKQFRAMTSR